MSNSLCCWKSGDAVDDARDCYIFRSRFLVLVHAVLFVTGGMLMYYVRIRQSVDWNLFYPAIALYVPLGVMIVCSLYELYDRRKSRNGGFDWASMKACLWLDRSALLTLFGSIGAAVGLSLVVTEYELDKSNEEMRGAGAWLIGAGAALVLLAMVVNFRFYPAAETDTTVQKALIHKNATAEIASS